MILSSRISKKPTTHSIADSVTKIAWPPSTLTAETRISVEYRLKPTNNTYSKTNIKAKVDNVPNNLKPKDLSYLLLIDNPLKIYNALLCGEARSA